MNLYAVRRKNDGQWYAGGGIWGEKRTSEARFGAKPKFYSSAEVARKMLLNTGHHWKINPDTQQCDFEFEVVTFKVTETGAKLIEKVMTSKEFLT